MILGSVATLLGYIAIGVLCLWGAAAMLFLGLLAWDERRYRRWHRRQRRSQ